MKRFFFYIFFGLMAFSSACGMFMLKFLVVNKEAQLAQMHKQIIENNRSTHVLRAEWSNLNNPGRLHVLAKENTSLSPIKQSQIIHWDNIEDSSEKTQGES